MKEEKIEELNFLEKENKEEMLINEKNKGNEYYLRGEFDLAINSYNVSKQIIPTLETEEKKNYYTELCDSNISQCLIMQKKYGECLEVSKRILEKNPENVKAIFRYGKSLSKIGEPEKAITVLEKIKNEKSAENEIIKIKKNMLEIESKLKKNLKGINFKK
jgi:FK506-binding protein 8